jgi:hypothetical protein
MASTRNRNTPGNFKLEQWSYEQKRIHQVYKHSANGEAITTHFAGNGLIGGWMPRTELSHNPVDIESYLHGTGSTNLVEPKSEPVLQRKTVNSLSIADRLPLLLPKPLYIEPNQRPLWS